MNPAVILALISDLYGQVTILQQEVEALRRAEPTEAAPEPPPGR